MAVSVLAQRARNHRLWAAHRALAGRVRHKTLIYPWWFPETELHLPMQRTQCVQSRATGRKPPWAWRRNSASREYGRLGSEDDRR